MINKVYAQKISLEQIKKVLDNKNSIQLQCFFEEEYFNKLKDRINKIILKKEFIPQLYSYSSADFKDKDIISTINNLISYLFNKSSKLSSSRIFSFQHRDYTLLSDSIRQDDGVKVIIELTDNWNDEANGYTSFVKDKKEVARINVINNSVSIIRTNNDMRSFVKYVNYKSKDKKRIFIELTYHF